MKLGIMQPYFFPYLGYFELIERTDRWVVFDVVQYKTKSWMNRNRILHPTQGWQYVGVPVQKAPRGTLIRDIRIKDKDAALARILGQLDHYKKRAPQFRYVVNLVREAFTTSHSDRLVDLNVALLASTCSYLDITFDWSLCSEMDLDLKDIEHPGQWALRIAAQLGAREYINPPGGRRIFDPVEWAGAGISLQFTELPSLCYDCAPYEFIEHLSILDVLMWNEPESVMAVLHKEANVHSK
jgi:hypothetical protein